VGVGAPLLLVWLATMPLSAQAPQTPVTPPNGQTKPTTAPSVDPREYVIGPGDLLSIGVFGVPELAQAMRVSNSGKIHVTSVGILKAAGRTVGQLESDIATELQKRDLVRQPWVVVKVDEVRAHPVYILGEVMFPGQFQITNQMYLSDLLTAAQGFNTVASPIGYLYRRKVDPATGEPDPNEDPDHDTMEAFPIDFQALQTGAKPELNVKLRAGDILYVPERKKEYVFVVGDVYQPGLFEIAGGSTPLLTQLMARAGGPTRTAKPSKVLLVRYGSDDARQEITVDFNAVIRGRSPDVPLQFGDLIFVPGSGAKTAGLSLLGIVPGVVQGRAIQSETSR
jgi:polysaccharide export outer membrane protein